MFGWILGGAAALGLGWLGYKSWAAGSGEVQGMLNFRPFAVKKGQPYIFHVLAPSGLEAFVMKMFKDDVADVRISPVAARKNLVLQGPGGPVNVDLYEHRVIWKAPDAKFTQASAMERMNIAPGKMSPPRALGAALYAAASQPAGTEARLRFFPIGATLDAAQATKSAGVG